MTLVGWDTFMTTHRHKGQVEESGQCLKWGKASGTQDAEPVFQIQMHEVSGMS